MCGVKKKVRRSVFFVGDLGSEVETERSELFNLVLHHKRVIFGHVETDFRTERNCLVEHVEVTQSECQLNGSIDLQAHLFIILFVIVLLDTNSTITNITADSELNILLAGLDLHY